MSTDSLSPSYNSFGLSAGQVPPSEEEVYIFSASQLEQIISQAVARAQAPLLQELHALQDRIESLEEEVGCGKEGEPEPHPSPPEAAGEQISLPQVVQDLQEENLALKQELDAFQDFVALERMKAKTEAEIVSCEQRINELLQEISQTQQARDEAIENAELCLQRAEELLALADELSTEEVTEELQEEIDFLIEQAEEELEKADSYTEAAEDLNYRLEELEAEKAGQETAKDGFEVQKAELLQDKEGLEDCLTLPVIEELAVSIAGSKLVQ